jgi:hypothetical protein
MLKKNDFLLSLLRLTGLEKGMANVEKDEKVSITRSASQWVYWQMFKKMKKSALHA